MPRRSRVYQHLQGLSIGFYDKKSVGGLMSNVTNDTSVLHSFGVDGLQNGLVNIMTLVGIGVTLFFMNRPLAFIVLVPTPTMVFGSKWFSRKLRLEVDTDRGPRTSEVRSREHIRFLPAGRILLRDLDGNRYEIPCVDDLDSHSRGLAEVFL